MRLIELAVNAGKKRQSPRTGFVHYFPKDDSAMDVIPVFENFCFALALFRQKSGDAIREGKDLIERLLGFQTESGNFPVYLHDYPKTWDFHLGLKVAPVLVHILRDFASVLNGEYKLMLETALKKMIQPPKSATWEHRYKALCGEKIPSLEPISPQNWFDWIVSDQLVNKANTIYPIPYNRELAVFLGENLSQQQGEVVPLPIEYVLAEKDGFPSKRHLRDHINQIYSALLYSFSSSTETSEPFCWQYDLSRLLWKGSSVHSLILPHAVKTGECFVFELPDGVEVTRDDLFEVQLFTDISPETSLYINDEKSMVFYLGDKVSIRTPQFTVDVRFEILKGEGEFCGGISRGNRPGQVSCVGLNQFEAYDWVIALRTLRRTGPCTIGCFIQIS
jgi:hypothetical protein